MAFIRDYELIGEVVVKKAYFAITNIILNKVLVEVVEGEIVPSSKWNVSFTISVFKNKEVRFKGGQPIAIITGTDLRLGIVASLVYDNINTNTILGQAYRFLREQEYFKNAIVDAGDLPEV